LSSAGVLPHAPAVGFDGGELDCGNGLLLLIRKPSTRSRRASCSRSSPSRHRWRKICFLLAAGVALVQFDEPVLTEVVYGTPGEGGRTFMCGALGESASA